MAQTKKKRRTKHRGTAAGTVEARGRTGRKPTPGESKARGGGQSRDRRTTRLDRPPTWRGALNRALIASALFFVAVLLLLDRPPGTAAALAALTLLIYVPMGYYTDLLIYTHRQRRKLKGRGR